MTTKLKLAIYAIVLTITTAILTIGMATTATAKTVIIDNDGAIEKLITQKDTVRDVLLEADTELTSEVRVSDDLNDAVEDNQVLKVRYAKPIKVVEDGLTYEWTTTAVTYNEALQAKNITFKTNAYISVDLATNVPDAGAEVVVSNPKRVKLVTQDLAKFYTTTSLTAGEFLLEQGVVLDANDRMNVSSTEALKPKMTVQVFNVAKKHVVQDEEFPLIVETREDASVALGEEKVIQEGVAKVVQRKLSITFTDGKVTKVKTVSEKVIAKAVPRIIATGTGMPEVDPSSAKAIAQRLMEAYGWNGAEFACLDILWTRESGWNYKADNPSSSAYGIPQALPGSKMSSAGEDWLTNPETQIKWGLGYIKDRYGSPCNAKAFSDSRGYY